MRGAALESPQKSHHLHVASPRGLCGRLMMLRPQQANSQPALFMPLDMLFLLMFLDMLLRHVCISLTLREMSLGLWPRLALVLMSYMMLPLSLSLLPRGFHGAGLLVSRLPEIAPHRLAAHLRLRAWWPLCHDRHSACPGGSCYIWPDNVGLVALDLHCT